MGYRIDYGPAMPRPRTPRRHSLRLQLLTALFLLLFVLGVRENWPEGSEKLQQILLPGADSSVSAMAFQSLVDNLQDGIPLGASVTAFCQEVIAHAETLG